MLTPLQFRRPPLMIDVEGWVRWRAEGEAEALGRGLELKNDTVARKRRGHDRAEDSS